MYYMLRSRSCWRSSAARGRRRWSWARSLNHANDTTAYTDGTDTSTTTTTTTTTSTTTTATDTITYNNNNERTHNNDNN